MTKKENPETDINEFNAHHINRDIRILFICKKRNDSYGISFGLVNSCKFISSALKKYGIHSEVIQVIDNNCIEREVVKYKPTHVFIEALWVVPEKIYILVRKYSNIHWLVRLHSEIPFLANEGIAFEWIKKYILIAEYNPNFKISSNSKRIKESFCDCFGINVSYNPNIYFPEKYDSMRIIHSIHDKVQKNNKFIDIGCFGAIRPMKNQVMQALAAISFGHKNNRTIRFHINSSRVEQKGDCILKNIRNIFEDSKHQLVEWDWMSHEDFIALVRCMDIGMQVSMSESFNIVSADFVDNNIPVVGSPEISWLNFLFVADPTNMQQIASKLEMIALGKHIGMQKLNKIKLNNYNEESTEEWLNFLHVNKRDKF